MQKETETTMAALLEQYEKLYNRARGNIKTASGILIIFAAVSLVLYIFNDSYVWSGFWLLMGLLGLGCAYACRKKICEYEPPADIRHTYTENTENHSRIQQVTLPFLYACTPGKEDECDYIDIQVQVLTQSFAFLTYLAGENGPEYEYHIQGRLYGYSCEKKSVIIYKKVCVLTLLPGVVRVIIVPHGMQEQLEQEFNAACLPVVQKIILGKVEKAVKRKVPLRKEPIQHWNFRQRIAQSTRTWARLDDWLLENRFDLFPVDDGGAYPYPLITPKDTEPYFRDPAFKKELAEIQNQFPQLPDILLGSSPEEFREILGLQGNGPE